MRLDSRLNLGSMNKMFTATVVGQLVDEGTLSFHDPVSKFLGGRGLDEGGHLEGRVEHLLSHRRASARTSTTPTSGWRQLLRKVDDYKPLVAEETSPSSPGRSGSTATPACCSRAP
jgi:CubicO group peptidase (beta-lactamase class C family)